MFPEAFAPLEPLSFGDHVILCRVNLCCAAAMLAVFALLAGSSNWEMRVLALLASAGLAFAMRQTEPILRCLDAALRRGEAGGAADRHPFPL